MCPWHSSHAELWSQGRSKVKLHPRFYQGALAPLFAPSKELEIEMATCQHTLIPPIYFTVLVHSFSLLVSSSSQVSSMQELSTLDVPLGMGNLYLAMLFLADVPSLFLERL